MIWPTRLQNQIVNRRCRNSVSEEAIRVLARSKWEAAGYPVGDRTNFWMEAAMNELVQCLRRNTSNETPLTANRSQSTCS